MHIVSVTDEFIKSYGTGDREFMNKRNCPCVLVLRLRFRGKRRNFAVPFRSNIAPNVPKNQYFALPPRPTTRPGCRHGIHYIKMFPIEKRFQRRFHTEGNPYYEMIQRILSKNEKYIVASCQKYLDDYEANGRPKYAVDLDRIIEMLEGRSISVALPPVHVPRPYARPTAPLAAHLDLPMEDGATIAAFVYSPWPDEPGTPFGLSPEAAPLLVLHGNGEEHGIFGPTIDAVVAQGRPVIAVDSRAQGASTRGTAPLSYDLMAADARAVCERLGAWQVHVLGFSDGGILGLLLARDWDEHVLTLTASGANLTPQGLGEEDTQWMAEAAAANRTWAEGGREGIFDEEGNAVPSPAEAAVIADLLQLMVDQPQIDAESLAAISCPTTIMAGEFDCVLPEETSRIAEAIPGAAMWIVEGAEHTIPKVAPDELTRAVMETMAENDRSWEPGSLGPNDVPADLAVARIPVSAVWADTLDALYEHVDAVGGSCGWVQGVWPPKGMAAALLAEGFLGSATYWGVFNAGQVKDGTPLPDAELLGAVAVNLDADFGPEADWEGLPAGSAATYHLLAVDPAARGRRVSLALLDAAECAARELGAVAVRINTSVANVEANGLYARWGFERHKPIWLPYEGLPLPGWTQLWEKRL